MKNKFFLIISIVFIFISLFFLKHHISIFYFQNDLNKIVLNLETQVKHNKEVYACFDKQCDKMSYSNGIYSYKLNQENPLFYVKPIKNIEILSNDKNLFHNAKLSVFIGNDLNLYENIKTIAQTTFFEKKFYTYDIPTIKTNEKNIIQKIGIYFESIFYNWYFFIFSYIFFLIYIQKNNTAIKNYKNAICYILIIGAILRLSHIDFVPLWNDELYCITYIKEGFTNILKDPGNPPLFFILSNLWLNLFNKSVAQIRLLPFLLGIIQIYSIYFITSKILNKKTGLISAFLSAINIFIIVESNEFRSYILAMSLVLWGGYCLYKLIKKENLKNYIFYLITLICLINTHYYCILYTIFNFCVGLYFLKEKKKFILLNLISFTTLIPYLLTSFSTSLTKDFNTWIEKPSIELLSNHVVFYFGNILFLTITLIFTIFVFKRKLPNKTQKNTTLYLISSIGFVFLSALVISFTIKPILFERYFCIFLPYLIIITSIYLTLNYSKKIQNIILILIFLFSINMPKYENFNLFSNIDLFVKYSLNDYRTLEKKYEAYFVIPDRIEYVNYYPDFKNIAKENIIVSNFGIREDKNLIEEYKKQIKTTPAVIYMPEICTNSKIKFSKNKNIQTIQTTITPVFKMYVE